jgi:hypothetical protein
VFGYGTDTINGVATATGIAQAAGSTFEYTCTTNGAWIQNGANAGGYTGTFDGVLGGVTPAAGTVTTLSASGNITMTAANKGLVLKQGANGKCGTFVCNGTTPVTISNTSIAITDTIVISLNTVGGTVGAIPHVATITASTGFTTVGTASDTSTYNYAIISNAA